MPFLYSSISGLRKRSKYDSTSRAYKLSLSSKILRIMLYPSIFVKNWNYSYKINFKWAPKPLYLALWRLWNIFEKLSMLQCYWKGGVNMSCFWKIRPTECYMKKIRVESFTKSRKDGRKKIVISPWTAKKGQNMRVQFWAIPPLPIAFL